MVLAPDQVQAIISALGPKITESCPTCGLSSRRQIVQELFIFTSYVSTSPPPHHAVYTSQRIRIPFSVHGGTSSAWYSGPDKNSLHHAYVQQLRFRGILQCSSFRLGDNSWTSSRRCPDPLIWHPKPHYRSAPPHQTRSATEGHKLTQFMGRDAL